MPTARFYPEDQSIPERMETSRFILTPLTPAHVELDYAALMSSKEMLRLWSGSPWPQDSFTLENNLSDLEWHYQEHGDREAFTYTVLTPEEDACLGCVYIRPLGEFVRDSSESLPPGVVIGDDEAAARFWVTQPWLAQDLDRSLLAALIDWFKRVWQFKRVLLLNRAADRRQHELFTGYGLRHEFALKMPSRGGVWEFWSFG